MPVPEGAASVRYTVYATDGNREVDVAFESTSAVQSPEVHTALEAAADAMVSVLSAAYPTVRAYRTYEGTLQGDAWPAP